MDIEKMIMERDDKYLVTGCAGFIGSNLVERLLSLGQTVVGIDNLSNGKVENISEHLENKKFTFIEGDICDMDTVNKTMNGVDYVLHQAAWGSVPRSMKMPVFYCEQNVNGTLTIFESARNNGVKKVVYASSSSVYGDEPNLPKYESRVGNILSPYALTKKVDELYGDLYSRVYGLPTIGLRYFNVFGRRQDPNSEYSAVIPKFVSLLLEGKEIKVNGDGLQSRDFTYIENVIEANLKSAHSNDSSNGKAINVAYGGQVTINELIENIAKRLEVEPNVVYGPDREGDIKHSNADISLAKELVGYNPKYSFFDGLDLTIKWYKDNN